MRWIYLGLLSLFMTSCGKPISSDLLPPAQFLAYSASVEEKKTSISSLVVKDFFKILLKNDGDFQGIMRSLNWSSLDLEKRGFYLEGDLALILRDPGEGQGLWKQPQSLHLKLEEQEELVIALYDRHTFLQQRAGQLWSNFLLRKHQKENANNTLLAIRNWQARVLYAQEFGTLHTKDRKFIRMSLLSWAFELERLEDKYRLAVSELQSFFPFKNFEESLKKPWEAPFLHFKEADRLVEEVMDSRWDFRILHFSIKRLEQQLLHREVKGDDRSYLSAILNKRRQELVKREKKSREHILSAMHSWKMHKKHFAHFSEDVQPFAKREVSKTLRFFSSTHVNLRPPLQAWLALYNSHKRSLLSLYGLYGAVHRLQAEGVRAEASEVLGDE